MSIPPVRAQAHPDRDRNAEGRAENARPRDRYGAPLPRGAVDELADRREPEDVCSTNREAFEIAVDLFDDQRFFEAHEFFEFIWKSEETDPADKDFWKGVAQVAVGACHTQRGNAHGAVTLLRRSTEYMGPYPDRHHRIDVAVLKAAALALAEQVEDRGASPEASFFRFPCAT